MAKEIILIDCNQCLLNYNQRIANIYEDVFGVKPIIKNAGAFKATNLYDFSTLKKRRSRKIPKSLFGCQLVVENASNGRGIRVR